MADPHHKLIERTGEAIDTCCAMGCPDCGLLCDLREALAERAAMPTRALNLLQVIADPECDPNDFAADGITVFQVIQRDAQETLALFARNQTDGDEEVIHKVQLLPGEVLRAFLASTAVSEPKGAET
jgi:hypothetical protein